MLAFSAGKHIKVIKNEREIDIADISDSSAAELEE